MTTVHARRPHGRAALDTLREAFWVLALGLLVCFAFFAALGAFDPTESTALGVAGIVLLALWTVHVLLASRHRGEHDPRLAHDRERRGF